MTIGGFVGMIFILVFFILMIIMVIAGRVRPDIALRQIPAYDKVRKAIIHTVEAGSRLHISIGRGNVIGPESAAAFVGLSMVEKMTPSISNGDDPPIVTTGNPALAILAQDTLKAVYTEIGQIGQYEASSGQLVGLTPFSFAAGGLPVVSDEKSATNILMGNFGVEVALLCDGSERSGNQTLAGTDDISAQAVLYATASEPLIGEELYAGGAYVDAGPLHTASLRAQDAMRWLLVIIILGGIVFQYLDLGKLITDILRSLL